MPTARRRRPAVPARALAGVAGLVLLAGVVAGGGLRPSPGVPADAAAVAAPAIASGPAAGRSLERPSAPGGPVEGVPATTDAGGAPSSTSDRVLVTEGLRPIPVPRLVPRDTVGPRWLTPDDRAAGLLGLDVPQAASGILDVVPGTAPAPGTAGVRTVRVEVERGLPVDGAAFAATVLATLNDPRGWGARGDVSFARTDGPADLRVVLASPALVDALCAPLRTGGEVSCGRNGHAALNLRRWVEATDEFGDRTQYRQYLVNHEVGHLLGHPHERCPGPGQPAPLMQQQTVHVAPCLPNGWPYPQG